jgi:hypothetical protein
MNQSQVKALLTAIQALGEAIKELHSVPSGHLYAHVMNNMSLENYQYCIDILKKAGKVKEENYLLSWVE